MIRKNLFSESVAAISKAQVAAVSPFTQDLSNKLTEAEPPMETKAIVDKIVDVYGQRAGDIQRASTQPGFYSFVGTLEQAFSKQTPPLLGDYGKEEKDKLAALVAYAYFLCTKDKTKAPQVYSNFDDGKIVAAAILQKMSNDLKLGKLLGDESMNPRFKQALTLAICASVWKEKKKADEKPEYKLPPQAPQPPAEQK